MESSFNCAQMQAVKPFSSVQKRDLVAIADLMEKIASYCSDRSAFFINIQQGICMQCFLYVCDEKYMMTFVRNVAALKKSYVGVHLGDGKGR